MANAEGNDGGVVGYDWDEVVGDDSEGMVVDTEFLNTFCAGVDQTKAVSLSRLEFEFGKASIGCAGGVGDQ